MGKPNLPSTIYVFIPKLAFRFLRGEVSACFIPKRTDPHMVFLRAPNISRVPENSIHALGFLQASKTLHVENPHTFKLQPACIKIEPAPRKTSMHAHSPKKPTTHPRRVQMKSLLAHILLECIPLSNYLKILTWGWRIVQVVGRREVGLRSG